MNTQNLTPILTNRRCIVRLTSCVIVILLATSLALAGATRPALEVYYTDSGDAIRGGCLLKANLLTGERTIVSRGGLLQIPFGLVVTQTGQIIVTDCGRLVQIDPETGKQTLLADVGWVAGISVDSDGDLLLAAYNSILRFKVSNQSLEVIAAGGYINCAFAVTEAPNGDLLVLNAGWPASIVRVSRKTGEQTVLSIGGRLNCPQSMVLHGNKLYVTDVATPDGNFGVGCVVSINIQTGEQIEITQGGLLVGPVGIAIGPKGYLVVGDPYSTISARADRYVGAVVIINPHTGEQRLVCRGEGSLVNPRGVALLPLLSPVPNRAKSARHTR